MLHALVLSNNSSIVEAWARSVLYFSLSSQNENENKMQPLVSVAWELGNVRRLRRLFAFVLQEYSWMFLLTSRLFSKRTEENFRSCFSFIDMKNWN